MSRPPELSAQGFVIDKADPGCDNQGPGTEWQPWCNLYGAHRYRFPPGSVVFIKKGTYVGNEDPDDGRLYHHAIDINGRGTADQPFTIRAWPGHEGQVEIRSASVEHGYAFVFRGSHIRFKGLTFIGHVEQADGRRLYSPRVIRFAITDGPVRDISFDGVRVLYFQGADDIGLGCRWPDRPPLGLCDFARSAEGWARGIELAGVGDFLFENGEISCSDDLGMAGLEDVKAKGLYLAADGVKSDKGCSNVTFRNNSFFSCGHNNLHLNYCHNVLIENNYFENDLHSSVGLKAGGFHTVRYNRFADWESRRAWTGHGGGAALQFRTSNSSVHHNIFYGGGEPNNQGAIVLAGLDDFVVSNNEIFNNVILGLNSMSFNLNDKFPEPFNIQNNKIYNNILIGKDTESGVLRWEAAERMAYLAGETFGNEIKNNILYSLSGDPEVVSTSRFTSPVSITQQRFNSSEVASGNIFGDPGLADVNFETPDFHILRSCIAIKAGLPVPAVHDFDGNLIADEGPSPSIGAYVATRRRVNPPVPVLPADKSTSVQAYTAFYWAAAEGATSYHLQVADDSTFTDPVVDLVGLTSLFFLPETPLPYSTRFFWRVRVASIEDMSLPEAADCTPWSHTQTFTVAVGTAAEAATDLPGENTLSEIYPNPVQTAAIISYSIPQPSEIHLTVHDTLGRVVAELVSGWVEVGRHSVLWRAENLKSGTYFVRLDGGGSMLTRSVQLIR